MRQDLQWGGGQRAGSSSLVDVLDRVLDKGLVIAGDIKISLADVELITIRIRLIVCSLDKAEEVGLDWWKYDDHFAPGREPLVAENEALRKQVQSLERKVAQLGEGGGPGSRRAALQQAGAAVEPTAAPAQASGAPQKQQQQSAQPAPPAAGRAKPPA